MTPRARRLITAALVVGALAVVAHAPALRLIGRALVVEDPLAQADAAHEELESRRAMGPIILVP